MSVAAILKWLSISTEASLSFAFLYCRLYSTDITVAILQPIAVINPIVPRKAKIVCNFGLSGCNKVKQFGTFSP